MQKKQGEREDARRYLPAADLFAALIAGSFWLLAHPEEWRATVEDARKIAKPFVADAAKLAALGLRVGKGTLEVGTNFLVFGPLTGAVSAAIFIAEVSTEEWYDPDWYKQKRR